MDVRYRQNRIKMLRRARGITVKRLAVLVGVSQSMLTNYENGSSIPRDQEVWDRLAVYFGCLFLISWAFEFDVTAGFNVRPAVFMPAWWR